MLPPLETRISWKDRAEEARAAVCATFDGLPRRVHGPKDLEMLLQKHRREWRLLAGITVTKLIDYLQNLHMEPIRLAGPGHNQERMRYGWRSPSVFDVAQSLQKRAYLSHRSAAFLNGLTDEPEQEI